MRKNFFILCFAMISSCFLLTGILLNHFLNSYFVDKTTSQMTGTVDSVINYITENTQNTAQLNNILDFYSLTSGSHIIVFDNQKSIVACSSYAEQKMINGKMPTLLVMEILNGGDVSVVDNFNLLFDTQVIVVGKPIRYDSHIIGGVFSVMPMPYLAELKYEIFKPFLFAMMIALVFAGIFSYLISKNIESPIREINNVLRLISKGNFEKRLDLNLGGELRYLSKDFNEIVSALQNQEMTRTNFISNVSHELRTPMTIITGFLQGILDGTIPEEKHSEYINLVINETKRLTRLVNDLLDVARIESGAKTMTFDVFDINELLRVSLLKFENKIEEKELDVRLIFESDSRSVYANQDSITRVVTNLIDNAVKFADPMGYICLKTEVRGDTVYISIENSGEGIPEDELALIWEKFHKSDKSRSMDKSGVGLGLYMVKSILRSHDRDIVAESKPGDYTKFTFTLKIHRHTGKEG